MAKILIKITSAIGIAGKIITPGDTIEVDAQLARNLMHRGKAELAVSAIPVALGDGESLVDLDECSDDELRDIAAEYQIKAGRKSRATLLAEIREYEAKAAAEALGGAPVDVPDQGAGAA